MPRGALIAALVLLGWKPQQTIIVHREIGWCGPHNSLHPWSRSLSPRVAELMISAAVRCGEGCGWHNFSDAELQNMLGIVRDARP